jgi:hypothetical protein
LDAKGYTKVPSLFVRLSVERDMIRSICSSSTQRRHEFQIRRPSSCWIRTYSVTALGMYTLALNFLFSYIPVIPVEAYQNQYSTISTKTNGVIYPWQRWTQQIHTGYQRRVAADPTFLSKSVTEVVVAAGSQFTAEWNRRGIDRLLPELDFVVPAILTAVIGKYYR